MFDTTPATAPASPRERRHAATRAEIVAAAWQLARRDGLAALSMRELAAAVGLRAPTLYAYVDGKGAVYDAMFRQGNEALAAVLPDVDEDATPEEARRRCREGAAAFVAFCTEDPVRYQLLFQRTIPGWEPSPSSFATAIEVLDRARRGLEAAGIDDEGSLDLWTALISGLVAQQISNEPGGDRWTRLLPRALDLFFDAHDRSDPEEDLP